MDHELIKVDENIYLLKGIRSCNIYFLDFGKKTIIDTGFFSEIESNIKTFKDNNIDLTKIDYIINTHSHGDHIGGNAFLKNLNPNALIVGSSKTAFYQEQRSKRSLLEGAEDKFPDYQIDLFVKENDKIDIGGCILKVHETPGHTIDSLSFEIETKNIFFTGDLIYKEVVSQVDYYQDLLLSLAELKASYEKLQNLNPKAFFPGHSFSITNPVENIKICLRKIIRFERQPELIVINNFVPSAEYYIHKNPGCSALEVKDFFLENMKKFKDDPFLIMIGEKRFGEMIDKMIALMRVMNMIKEENGLIYLVKGINQNLNNN